jgi:hypothetical protein
MIDLKELLGVFILNTTLEDKLIETLRKYCNPLTLQ